VTFSPDGRYFVDVAQTHDKPPVTVLTTADGKQVAELASSDVAKYEQLGLKPAELYTFTAADGKTQLHALLQKPSSFDSTKKYPVLVTVYGGPATNGARETFTTPVAAHGVRLQSSCPSTPRSAAGRGKRFLDAIYQKLGTVEIDDQAEGVKALWIARTSIATASGSSARRTAAMRRVSHCSATPMCSRRRRRPHRHRLAPLRLDLHRALHVAA
jgi:dipeptidyl-peptidase-4